MIYWICFDGACTHLLFTMYYWGDETFLHIYASSLYKMWSQSRKIVGKNRLKDHLDRKSVKESTNAFSTLWKRSRTRANPLTLSSVLIHLYEDPMTLDARIHLGCNMKRWSKSDFDNYPPACAVSSWYDMDYCIGFSSLRQCISTAADHKHKNKTKNKLFTTPWRRSVRESNACVDHAHQALWARAKMSDRKLSAYPCDVTGAMTVATGSTTWGRREILHLARVERFVFNVLEPRTPESKKNNNE